MNQERSSLIPRGDRATQLKLTLGGDAGDSKELMESTSKISRCLKTIEISTMAQKQRFSRIAHSMTLVIRDE